MQNRILNYHKEPFDGQDYKYREIRPRGLVIPGVKDTLCPPVKDQGEDGSCASQAVTLAMEAAEVRNVYPDWWVFSANELYYRYRELYDRVDEDNGGYIRDLLRLAAAEGVCRESYHPKALGMYAKPSAAALEEAKSHKIKTYWSLEGAEDFFACLGHDDAGFVGGFALFESFDDAEKDGIVRMPERGERMEGGHAMYIRGYDLHFRFGAMPRLNAGMRPALKLRNSWGDWGLAGDLWMPLEYALMYGSDFWTIRALTVHELQRRYK